MLKDYLKNLETVSKDDVKFYLITRKLKKGISKSKKVLDKYDFMLYQIRISDEIRAELLDLTKSQISYLIKKGFEFSEYEVIDSDEKKIYTYQLTNKAISFSTIVDDQLKKGVDIPLIKSIDNILQDEENKEELWAYCIGLKDSSGNWSYSFRKSSKGKVFVESKDNPEFVKIHNVIRTYFDIKSAKLEMLHGDTIMLDKKIDCLYLNEKFFIFQKFNFEKIIGLEFEYKEKAQELVDELSKSEMIEGVEILKKAIENKPALHRRLVRIYNNPDYKNLSKKRIEAMKAIASDLGLTLKERNGKLLIEEESDINIVIRMLEDYYLESKQTGFKYGSAVKKKIK